MQVIKVDPQKCTGCHQCELWCGTEIASLSKELYGALKEEPQPVPRVYVEGKNLALQCRHCVEAPCLGRNTMAATNALSTANMARAGFRHLIPLDRGVFDD